MLEPGDRLKISEVLEHDGDILFLKLADGRGWCVDREIGHEMCYELDQEVDELWKYSPANGKPIVLRDGPHIDGPKTGNKLNPEEKFKVCEIKAGQHNVLFLKVAGDRGWVFDEKPDQHGETPDGIMCKRILDELWTYEPENGKPISIRKGPELNGAKTSFLMYPNEMFRVEEVEAGEGDDVGVLFLKLADGRGWLLDRHPEQGQLCRRATLEPGSVVTTKDSEGNRIRLQTVEEFKVGAKVQIQSGKADGGGGRRRSWRTRTSSS
ncbi:unnamed protein product [Prorocentrum cordatum]|uniref:Uncharacterized protein n=1 Tax=Prorocentrum cordatum TaxID=2364126 RepID=A0ABN9UCD1_9DINO|nr:unnamed protein product [Polarella glacialis]